MKACVLNITKSIAPKAKDVIAYSRPYFNNVFIYSVSMSQYNMFTLYGDMIKLSAWKRLKLKFGTPDGQKVWTRQDGYIYRLTYKKRLFQIWDEHGTEVYKVENVTSIADMHIDFTIHKSHQFGVVLDGSDVSGGFMFPSWLVKKQYGESPIQGIRPLLRRDKNKGSTKKRHYGYGYGIRNIDVDNFKVDKYVSVKGVIKPTSIYHLPGENKYTSEINKPYDFKFKNVDAQRVIKPFKSVALKWRLVVPVITLALYPWLLPILRQDEFLNNRPVYEPWLIWGVYKILTNIRDDEEGEEFDVLDLSPNWSY